MNIERVNHNGHIIVSDIIKGNRVAKTYIGYTISEAIEMFKEEIADEHKRNQALHRGRKI